MPKIASSVKKASRPGEKTELIVLHGFASTTNIVIFTHPSLPLHSANLEDEDCVSSV